MKNLWLASIVLLYLFTGSIVQAAATSEPGPLLPESLAARNEMAGNQKTLTILLEEEDAKKATTLLNTSNEDYSKKGWTVFLIMPYNHDESFRGFFVTYQKALVFE